MIKEAKIDYYSSQVNESAGNQTKLFEVIDNLLHKSKIPVLPSSDSDELLAIKFSEFFHQKIENIRKTFNTSSSNISPHVTLNSSHLQMPKLCSFTPTNVEEIKKVIMKSPSKSCELDALPTSLIKDNIDVLASYNKYCEQIINVWNFPAKPKNWVCSSSHQEAYFGQRNL